MQRFFIERLAIFMNTEKFTHEKVLWVKRHTDKLMTFAISRPAAYRFSAGQFSRLGLNLNGTTIWRAYSIMSPEYAEHLEYIAVLIPNGDMSLCFQNMQENNCIYLDKNATGFLLPQRFADGRDLVMLSTGSGIAPFLSQLNQINLWQRFEHIVLVHSVSHTDELIFSGRLQQLSSHPLVGEYAHRLTYIPITTQDNGGMLHQRIPYLLSNGTLSRTCQIDFNPQDTRFMICGNPSMVEDTYSALKQLGFTMNRNRTPGQILMENGF